MSADLTRQKVSLVAASAALVAGGLLFLTASSANAADCPSWTDPTGDSNLFGEATGATKDDDLDVVAAGVTFDAAGGMTASVKVAKLSPTGPKLYAGDQFLVRFSAGSTTVQSIVTRDARTGAITAGLAGAAQTSGTAVFNLATNTVTATFTPATVTAAFGRPAAGTVLTGFTGQTFVYTSTPVFSQGYPVVDTASAPTSLTYTDAGGCGPAVESTPSATATETPTATGTPAPTDTPSATPTETPTEAPAPTETPTETPAPTETPSETPARTDTPSETPAATETPSETPAPTDAPSEAPAATETPAVTPTPAATPTDAPSATPTEAPASSPTGTPVATATPTATPTPTMTETATPTPTATATPSPTATATPTPTPTPTDAAPPTPTPSPSPAPSPAPTSNGSPAVPARLAVASGPRTVTYGVPTRIAGRLMTSSGQGVGGQRVDLQVRRHGSSSAFVRVASLDTDARGYAVFTTYRPTFPLDYRLVHGRIASTLRSASIQRNVSATWSAARVRAGQATRLSGTVSPGSAGLTATLQVRRGTSWVSVASQKLGQGGYAFTVRPTSGGSYTYRVHVPAAAPFVASVGVAPTLTVS